MHYRSDSDSEEEDFEQQGQQLFITRVSLINQLPLQELDYNSDTPTTGTSVLLDTATSLESQQQVSGSTTDKKEQMSCNLLVESIAEASGTATIMIIGCSGCIHDSYPVSVSHQFASLTFGIAVALAVQLFGHISGAHFNPVVTLAALIMDKIDIVKVPFYFVAQIIGAILGYGLLLLLLPQSFTKGLCVTAPNIVTIIQAFFIEVLLTSFLVLACCSIWDKRCAAYGDSVSIRLGLMLGGMFIALGPFTGAGINPARSLAPAIFQNKWEAHWIYWIGPLFGSVLAATLYRYTFVEGLSRIGNKND